MSHFHRSSVVWWVLWCALLGSLSQDVAAQSQVGDTVVLENRELHIPAHPAPGDLSVPFRFAGGSVAEVLAVDAGTGWLRVEGERPDGARAIGWIVERYVVGTAPGGGDGGPVSSGQPGWCPDKGSPDPHPSGRLRIASWNIENLHAVDGRSTYLSPDASVRRYPLDYARIRCYVRLFDPDILAVQEVDGAEALRRVVDLDVYDVHVSSRPRGDNMGGRQNTGFAYKRGLSVQTRPDVSALNTNTRLRHGARIDVTHNGQTLKLMSVHLKSGCVTNGVGGLDCNTLFGQLPVLEEWIDTAATGPEPFIVLGDFNRRLNEAGDLVWAELDDGQPANADLTALTEDMPISCRMNRFTEFIDHIVVDRRGLAMVDRSSFRHLTYRQADKAVWGRLSDHCPVVVELWPAP